MKKVLIIDDEEKLRTLMSRIISLEGFEVLQAADCRSGLKKLEQNDIDIILCDVKLPDGSGVELCTVIKKTYPLREVILLTAYGNIPDGVQAIKNGAFDYIIKGDDNNKIVPLLYKAAEKTDLTKRVQHLEQRLQSRYSFDNVIGRSEEIILAIGMAKKVACTDTTVLLTGETGTGKEVFAQAIHQTSNRSNKNFIAINCSAFSKELLESEMFGFKQGAFTGALKDKKGLFEEADQGTIFMDEIGEMPLDLQAKLLRVVESGEFIRIGESKPTKVNVRIITATNRDLEHEIRSGHFREDLFYRISVFQIKLPALDERTGDIEMLAMHFLEIFAAKTNKKVTGFSKDCLESLQMHHWKGNIRELKNIVERAVILTAGNILQVSDLPLDFKRETRNQDTKQLSAFDLASAEKLHIQKVMNYTKGNKTETARLLNIALTTLYRKLNEYGIS